MRLKETYFFKNQELQISCEYDGQDIDFEQPIKIKIVSGGVTIDASKLFELAQLDKAIVCENIDWQALYNAATAKNDTDGLDEAIERYYEEKYPNY